MLHELVRKRRAILIIMKATIDHRKIDSQQSIGVYFYIISQYNKNKNEKIRIIMLVMRCLNVFLLP